MEKNEGALKRLMEYLVAHLYRNTPAAEHSDRALRTLSGQLTRNPPYVDDSFQIDGSVENALAGAVSAKGEVAWVVDSTPRGQRKTELRLVTRHNGTRTTRLLGEIKEDHRVPDVKVWFDRCSSNPIVLINGVHLKWGIVGITLPESHRCLTVWTDHGCSLHVAYVLEGEAFHHAWGESFDEDVEHGRLNANGPTCWIGLVRDSLAQITIGDDQVVLRWCSIKASAASGSIFVESITASAGWLQFVVDSGCAGKTVYYSDGRELKGSTVPEGDVIFGGGHIFMVHRGPSRGEIMRLQRNEWVRCAEQGTVPVGGPMPAIGKNARVFDFGDTVVVSDFSGPANKSVKRVWKITGEVTSCSSSSPEDIAIERFHHGIGIHRKADNGDEYVHWEAPSALKIGAFDNFPLYGTPFDRLVAVEDDRGKAVMSWAFTDGTFHVLRYPLPSR